MEASAVTQKAFTTYRREAEAEEHQAAADGTPVPTADKSQEEGEMSVIITIMQPILRLMQLLCENHNRDLQVSLFLSQDFHFASATSGPRLPPRTAPAQTFPDLCSDSLLPHSVTKKRNRIENRCRLQNFCVAAVPISGACWSGFAFRSVQGNNNGWLKCPQTEDFLCAQIHCMPQTSGVFH